MSENQEQIAVMKWAELQSGKYPELTLLFHIPNGSNKSPAQAGLFKALGLKAGVPDLFLPSPKKGYHGLFIEMKVKTGKTTQSQNEWISELRYQGYKAEVAHGFDEAVEIIKGYIA